MFGETFKHVMDWGLGVIIDAKRYGSGVPYGFGQSASPRAFGHGGSQSSAGVADPGHVLVVALIFNGLPGEARHDRRLKRVTAAIYENFGAGDGHLDVVEDPTTNSPSRSDCPRSAFSLLLDLKNDTRHVAPAGSRIAR